MNNVYVCQLRALTALCTWPYEWQLSVPIENCCVMPLGKLSHHKKHYFWRTFGFICHSSTEGCCIRVIVSDQPVGFAVKWHLQCCTVLYVRSRRQVSWCTRNYLHNQRTTVFWAHREGLQLCEQTAAGLVDTGEESDGKARVCQIIFLSRLHFITCVIVLSLGLFCYVKWWHVTNELMTIVNIARAGIHRVKFNNSSQIQ